MIGGSKIRKFALCCKNIQQKARFAQRKQTVARVAKILGIHRVEELGGYLMKCGEPFGLAALILK